MTYREFSKELQTAQESIRVMLIHKGFRGHEIALYHLATETPKIGINWSGIGTVGKEEARAFAECLNKAAHIVQIFNDLHCDEKIIYSE